MIKKERGKMYKVSDEGAFVEISLLSPISAISLKVDHQNPKIRSKLKKILGQGVPSVESHTKHGQISLCWISNDELLLLNETEEKKDLLKKIRKELSNTHSLVENVTDMRAWFLIEGEGSIDLLRKGVPKDFSRLDLSSKNFFRSRLGEVQVNILIKSYEQVVISVLRSVQGYTSQWLKQCSQKGSEISFDL
tara:strand:+ start:2244 stop:2819 length:576 start_codon:yes stop_codon:yes gene_type:complete